VHTRARKRSEEAFAAANRPVDRTRRSFGWNRARGFEILQPPRPAQLAMDRESRMASSALKGDARMVRDRISWAGRVAAIFSKPRALSSQASTLSCPQAFAARTLSSACARAYAQNLFCTYGRRKTARSVWPSTLIADTRARRIRDAGSFVEIVDESGNVIASGQEGIVRVHNAPDRRSLFGGSGAIHGGVPHGWFYPGDIGHLTPTACW